MLTCSNNLILFVVLFRCNVGHASTCNTVGQTAGFFLGYVLFLALESPYFCNKYLRNIPQDTGLVTLSSFLLFWGWIFIIVTTLIAIFKHEAKDIPNKDRQVKGTKDIVNAYKQLYTIVKLPSVRTLALVLFTAKVNDNSNTPQLFSINVFMHQNHLFQKSTY